MEGAKGWESHAVPCPVPKCKIANNASSTRSNFIMDTTRATTTTDVWLWGFRNKRVHWEGVWLALCICVWAWLIARASSVTSAVKTHTCTCTDFHMLWHATYCCRGDAFNADSTGFVYACVVSRSAASCVQHTSRRSDDERDLCVCVCWWCE